MADFARPDLLVTVTFKTLADDTPTDVTGQLLKHRLKGGPASGVEVTLTRTGPGTYTGRIAKVPGEHRLIAGSSEADDAVDVEEVTYTVDPLNFPQ